MVNFDARSYSDCKDTKKNYKPTKRGIIFTLSPITEDKMATKQKRLPIFSYRQTANN